MTDTQPTDEQRPANLHARIYRAVYTSPDGAAVEAVLAEVEPELAALRAHLALATVLEIPRPIGFPLQLRRSYGHTDRWAICDRTGRRWARDGGWWYDPAHEENCDRTRFTLAEALPLAHALAAGTAEDAANPWSADAAWTSADDPAADAEGRAEQAAEHLPHD
jgi:hypothetical protein